MQEKQPIRSYQSGGPVVSWNVESYQTPSETPDGLPISDGCFAIGRDAAGNPREARYLILNNEERKLLEEKNFEKLTEIYNQQLGGKPADPWSTL